MSFTVRPATDEDLPTLRSLEKELIAFERHFDNGIKKEENTAYYNIKELIRSEKSQVFIAKSEGKAVGCVFGKIQKNESWANPPEYGYIGFLFVEEEYRQKGVGTLLLNEVIVWFKKNDIEDIRIKLYTKNAKAIDVYRKYGFKDFVLEMNL